MCCRLSYDICKWFGILGYGRKTVSSVSCIFSVTRSRGRSKPGQEAPEKLSSKSCKLLNAVCRKTFPKSAEKRIRAH